MLDKKFIAGFAFNGFLCPLCGREIVHGSPCVVLNMPLHSKRYGNWVPLYPAHTDCELVTSRWTPEMWASHTIEKFKEQYLAYWPHARKAKDNGPKET